MRLVAEATEGYAGADLKALSSAAALSRIRKALPDLSENLLSGDRAQEFAHAMVALKVGTFIKLHRWGSVCALMCAFYDARH